MLPLDPRFFFCLAGFACPSVHGRKGSGPSIHLSQSCPWGVTFPTPCRASRLLSLQIPTGIIARQPIVRVAIQMTRMATGHGTAAMIQVLWLPWITEDVYEFRWG
jgi:hypothetical protein